VANIRAALGQLGSRWPLLVLEEGQNFSASALEEVRLLTCARSDTRPPFSLLLIGEDSLLPRLQMGINHALISRLGFALALTRLEPAHSREYVSARLRAVGVHSNPFEDQGLELLIQTASGLPRARKLCCTKEFRRPSFRFKLHFRAQIPGAISQRRGRKDGSPDRLPLFCAEPVSEKQGECLLRS
jgi:type II secretory pathway predicted ATPase ExeA